VNADKPLANARSIRRFITEERLSKYDVVAGDDQVLAPDLYERNTALSEAFYAPLQTLEVTLRNAMNSALSEAFGAEWFAERLDRFQFSQRKALEDAANKIKRQSKPLTNGRVVAELSFGFWTGIYGRHYESFWRKILRPCFVNGPKRLVRKDVHGRLDRLRLLRNRIAHHEPLLNWDLRGEYENALEVVSWLSPVTAQWARRHSRFEATYNAPQTDRLRRHIEETLR